MGAICVLLVDLERGQATHLHVAGTRSFLSSFTNIFIQVGGYRIAIDFPASDCIMQFVGAVPRIGEQNAKYYSVVRKHIF